MKGKLAINSTKIFWFKKAPKGSKRRCLSTRAQEEELDTHRFQVNAGKTRLNTGYFHLVFEGLDLEFQLENSEFGSEQSKPATHWMFHAGLPTRGWNLK